MKGKLREFWVVVTDDRRKATVLGALLLLLMGLGVKTFFDGPGPRGSDAAIKRDPGSNVTDAGQNAVTRTMVALGGGPSSRVISLAPTPRLSRNLFSLDESYFPRPAQTEQPRVSSKGSSAPVIEARLENADELKARSVARVEEQARSLRLRSIVLGQNPIAVIESKDRARNVVRIGQAIDGLTLMEVVTNSVVLEMDGVRVRLSLARPDR